MNDLYVSRYLLCALALSASVVLADPPRQSRQIQFIQVFGQYRVALDTDPPWQWSVSQGNDSNTFTAYSPDNYYPPATLSIRFYPHLNISAQAQALQQAALAAAERAANNFQATPPKADALRPVNFRHSTSYTTTLEVKHQEQEIDIGLYTGRFADGSVYSMTVYSGRDKLPHLSHVISRIGNSLQRINQKAE